MAMRLWACIAPFIWRVTSGDYMVNKTNVWVAFNILMYESTGFRFKYTKIR